MDKHLVQYPVLAIRDSVVMPHSQSILSIGRAKSLNVLRQLSMHDHVLIVAQRDELVDNPKPDDLFHTGTLCSILNIHDMPDESCRVVVKGEARFIVEKFFELDDRLMCEGSFLKTLQEDETEIEASRRLVIEDLQKHQRLVERKATDPFPEIINQSDPEEMVDLLAARLKSMTTTIRQSILEQVSLKERLNLLALHLQSEIKIVRCENDLRKAIHKKATKHQEEYLARMRSEVLMESHENSEFSMLEKRIKDAKMPSETRALAERELSKLKSMSAMSSEAGVVRQYLDWLCSLPWSHRSRLETNLTKAEDILDEEHYGLSKVKKEIARYIAVYNRTKKSQGTVLCLVGPPGVGKTSLGKSIAKATKRVFTRVALGGVRDESEIRGHRRTYVGAMPGKIIQQLKRCGTSNPLFMLDEIDKMGYDGRSDPSAALLEVLDPEQNREFMDHYLDTPFPLHECMFVCTANSVQSIPHALLDRMDVIYLSSYTQDEKVEIACRHLVPKHKMRCNLSDDDFSISPETLRYLINAYTREAGVRRLDSLIKALTSETVRQIEIGSITQAVVSEQMINTYLGARRYGHNKPRLCDAVGVVTGLAWTETGGDLLPIEAVLVPGKGKVSATGKLGDVMKESVQIAFGFLRSQACAHGVDLAILQGYDIQIHAPEGAIPKDGPSAGVAMFLAMMSALLKKPIRKDIAVTGEISLTGQVWAVGGIKEKVLAAHRGGVKVIMIPEENMKDLEDIPSLILEELSIIPLEHAHQAVCHALIGFTLPESSEEYDGKKNDGASFKPIAIHN